MVDVGFYADTVKSIRRIRKYPDQVHIVLSDGTDILIFDRDHVINVEVEDEKNEGNK